MKRCNELFLSQYSFTFADNSEMKSFVAKSLSHSHAHTHATSLTHLNTLKHPFPHSHSSLTLSVARFDECVAERLQWLLTKAYLSLSEISFSLSYFQLRNHPSLFDEFSHSFGRHIIPNRDGGM